MKRREFIELMAAGGIGAMLPTALSGKETAVSGGGDKLIGMYVHQHWTYNRPYAARTWTYEDWCGYLDGLHRLGFNLVQIWPMLETVPRPMAPSDKANLDKIRRVIDTAHQEFHMKVWIVLCPNNLAIDEHARRVSFERRRCFGSDIRVNPADSKAVDAMMAWREELLRPLAQADAVVIIDSDPGGYPNSTNREFVDLLMRHRQLLDKLRPGGIELVYWCWAGWPAYARYYTTGNFAWGTEQEFLEALTMLKERNPEPWGLARGLEHASKLGLQSKVIDFNYGAIESEPSFPMTNFGGAYGAGRGAAPRGVMGNAQTHCVQLPNTFAFARGAKGLPLTDQDYVQFANDLVAGHGALILAAWQALGGSDGGRMREVAARLAPLARAKLQPGPLKGLLFGDANRFMKDLYLMLRAEGACADFVAASQKGLPIMEPYAELVRWLERWQLVTGYESAWQWRYGGELNTALHKLQAPPLEAFFAEGDEGNTPPERIAANLFRMETQTLRLMQAMKRALWEMDPAYPDSSKKCDAQ